VEQTKHNSVHKIRDRLLYYIVRSLAWLLRLLPRRAGFRTMRFLGRILFLTACSVRKRTILHLTLALGDEKSATEIKILARCVFQHFCSMLVDIFRLPELVRQGINDLVTAEGFECVNKSRRGGRGVILLTGHFGNWEVLGAWIAQNGCPLKVVGRELFNPQLDQLLVNLRNQAGYTNIARGRATREIVRCLQDGFAVGMLIDQDTRVPGVFVNFFGRPTHTPVGPVLLAQKYGLDIIPVFMYLRDDLTYRIECMPPIALEKTGNIEEDLFNNTQKCSDAYERIIRRYPEQWVWMHKRWKKQPERYGNEAIGSKGIYGKAR